MTTVVARTFANSVAAQAAADELLRRGFESDAVHTAAADGGTTVSVRAEFGEGLKATRILESHGPVGTADRHVQSARRPTRDSVTVALQAEAHNQEAAPLSTALGLPLLSHNPAPLSSWLGLPLLSASQSPSVSLSPENPAPLSSSLGLPTLIKSGGRPVKLPSDNPAPLSSALGLPLLTTASEKPANLPSENAAPFSAMLRLPVLTRDSGIRARAPASTVDTRNQP